MARTPYKISAEEKKARRKLFYREGAEVDDETCYPEEKVVKAVDRAAKHEDDWPMFEFVEVTAKAADGQNANLLFSLKDGKAFTVKGQVHVEKDLKSHCK